MDINDNEIALTVKGLNKSYGSHDVLKNLDLELKKGAVLGLVGLNGSGKTTTIECLLGLQSANSGLISLLTFSPQSLCEANGKVIGVFDTPSLHPNLTVHQSLEHAALLCEKIVRTPQQVETLLGIERFSKFKIRNLSLGNKRRASIAHALLAGPDLIILDEPFNGLDAGGVDDVLELIRFLNQQEGTSFLLSSHQLPYLENICSHVAILHHGKICVNGAIDTLLSDTGLTIKLRTSNESAAMTVVNSSNKIEILSSDSEGYINLSLSDMNSAELNRLLVENQVAVDELIVKTPSLTDLFREITSENNA